jgi:hypothetical protein
MELSALGIIGVLLIWLVADWLGEREDEKLRKKFRETLGRDDDQ